MKVLVPIEDPLFAGLVVQFIKHHKWSPTVEFLVLHVVEPLELEHSILSADRALLYQCTEKVVTQSTALVASVANAIREVVPGAIVTQETTEAHLREEILRVSKQWGADLILLGSHGRQGFSHFALGSISLDLAATSQTPVVLLKPAAPMLKQWESLDFPALMHQPVTQTAENELKTFSNTRRVLVALDETDTSEAVIQFITRHDWPAEVEFKLLSIISQRKKLRILKRNRAIDSHHLVKEREAHVAKFAIVLRGEVPNSTISAAIGSGDPRQIILRTAQTWHPDLLILGCHFSSTFDRIVHGSVSLPTICGAPCAVWLVKQRVSAWVENQCTKEIVEMAPPA